MPTKRERRPGASKIMGGIREREKMLDDGVRPEGRLFVRVVDIPEPGEHDAASIKALRERLGVSQAKFAKMVGVSVVLAQSWEQGRRFPSPMARRLLDTVQTQPGQFMASMKLNPPPKVPPAKVRRRA